MRRDINAAIFDTGRNRVLVQVCIQRTTYSTQTVVAVGKDTGNGKLFEAAGAGGLQNTNIGVVVNAHAVKSDVKVLHIAAAIV